METKDNAQFHIVLAKAWVEKDGKYLMGQRSIEELHLPGAWSLPGGKLENEVGPHVVRDTLKKEIMEEVGVEIRDDIELVYTSAFKRVDGAHVVNLTFLAHHKSGEAKALEDTAAVKWFTLDELKNFPQPDDWLLHEINALAAHVQA